MGFRYCPDCDHWWSTAEYGFADDGETVCQQYPTHGATHGFIDGHMKTVAEFEAAHPSSTYRDRDAMIEAAKRQGLLKP